MYLIHCSNGKEIRSTIKTKLSQEDTVHYLKSTKFTRAEAGTYKCIATNPIGSAECEAVVTLYGKFSFIFSQKICTI